MTMSRLDPLIRPREYFQNTNGVFGEGAIVLGGYFVATMLLLVVVLEMLIRRVEGAPSGLRSEMIPLLFGTGFFAAIFILVAWVVVAAVMHFIGGFGTDGSYKHALGLAGWAYTPEIISTPVHWFLIWLELRGVRFDGSDPAVFRSQIEEFQSVAGPDFGLVVLIGVVLWSMFILARGVQGTHDAEATSAWFAAGIVALGSLFFTLLASPSGI